MNYRKHGSGANLNEVILGKMHKEWCTPGFIEAVKIPLDFLYSCVCSASCNYCPNAGDIFRPFTIIKPSAVRVVVVAQDPYPRLSDANGIGFMVKSGKPSVSLLNMKRCLVKFDHDGPDGFDLIPWVKQGVLLMNVTFTTKEGESGSHTSTWEGVAEKLLAQIPKDTVALLLGKDAKAISSKVPSGIKIEHLHPAERGGRFHLRDIFGEVNTALAAMNHSPIDWRMGAST